MKNYRFLFLIMALLLCGCDSTTAVEYKDPSLYAMTISDLHYTSDPNVIASIVPSMPYSPQVTDAIVNEVIAAHPDVFIMTGDNTNSGNDYEMEEVAERMRRIRDAGIKVIITPGNHDFNHKLIDTYRNTIQAVCDIDHADPDSFSYYTDLGNVRIFAMDDSSFTEGGKGMFSKETMKWLKTSLKKAEADGMRVLFLSHHTVLYGESDEHNDNYRINNEGLYELLRQHHVEIVMCGHLHFQAITERNGMYEVIQGMPLTGNHTIGFFHMNETGVQYHCEPIDLEACGEAGLKQAMEEADRKSAAVIGSVYEEILDQKNITGAKREGILNLLSRFYDAFVEGTIQNQVGAIKNDPYYDAMLEAMADENYGPWIESVMSDPPLNGRSLEFCWNP